MKTSIYYFSGTGNSLHAADELKKRISDSELIPIVSLLKKDIIKIESETVGIVFPIHLTILPTPVREFIERVDFSSARYIFAFLTQQGTFYTADHFMRKILKKKGAKLNAFFIQNMINNSPTGIRPTPGDKNWPEKISEDKIAFLEKPFQDRLEQVADIIINKRDYYEPGSGSLLMKILNPLFSMMTKNNRAEIKYFADDTCTDCGRCQKVCLSNKIKLVNKKPVWQQDIICYHCFACFNFCPEQAILIKYYKDKNGRYHHPDVTMEEIAAQK